jgi:hypothetical protein
MLSLVEEAGSASNGRIICGRCWSLETRTSRDLHDKHILCKNYILTTGDWFTNESGKKKLVCLSTRAKIIKQARIHGRFNDETQEIAILFSKIDPNTFSEKSPVDGKIDADHDRIETNSSDIPSLALRSPLTQKTPQKGKDEFEEKKEEEQDLYVVSSSSPHISSSLVRPISIINLIQFIEAKGI